MPEQTTEITTGQKPVPQTGLQAEFKTAPRAGQPNSTLEKPEFKAAVGMSRKWDAREAGREVAIDTLNKLGKNVKPDFFLLFSTMHYRKHGGFQELLNGVWDLLPKGTTLIGGTVQGFINNYGCFTRGVSALAVYSPKIDLSIGIGHHTKSNPKNAVSQVTKYLGGDQKENGNSCIIEVISGVTIPNLPFVGRQTIIEESLIGKIISKLFFLSSFVNTGLDKADEIIEYLSTNFKDSKIIGCCLSDSGKFTRNYQFYGKEVFTNSLICLKIMSDYNFVIKSIQALVPTGKRIYISDFSRDRRTIKKIDGVNAANKYLNILGTDLRFLGKRHIVSRTTFYYPMTYKKGEFYHPCVVGPIVNGELIVGNKIEESDLEFCRLSPTLMIDNVLKLAKELKIYNPPFVYGVICQTVLETLGNHIYKIHLMFKENLGETPFLAVLSTGESVYNNGTAHHLYESFNTLIVDTKK